MTPTEAASTLRALGWRCEPPHPRPAPTLAPESEAAVAPPQAPRVGEVWWSYKARVASRRVVGFEQRWGKECVVYTSGNGSDTTHLPLASWHAWVRKSGSQRVWPPDPAPQPTPVLAALAPADGAVAPRVGEVWEAPDYIARTVANIDAWHVWYRLHGYPGRVHAAKQSRWCAWVRRSGARVAP